MVLLGLLIALFFYQIVATIIDDNRYPPSGELVDIGGYKLHLNASGSEKPTVVLDAGLSGTSLGWSLIQPEVSKFAKVCSYDRAGYGWSDPSPLKRTSLNIAKELHALLIKANIPGPYILVGHSFGGTNMLMFADLYPNETLGVILVDAVHEDLLKELPDPPESFFNKLTDHPKMQWFLAAIGYKRLKGPPERIKDMFIPFPKEIQDKYIAQMNKTLYTQTVNQESEYLEESLAQLDERKVHLKDIPLIVITAGILADGDEGKRWASLQKNLLAKSNRSKQIIAENSDHMINHHQPQIIVDAIRELAAARHED